MDGSRQLALALTRENSPETPLEESVRRPGRGAGSSAELAGALELLCHRCARVTKWIAARGVERCEGCGYRFPCAGRCSHLDCKEYRAARGGRGEKS